MEARELECWRGSGFRTRIQVTKALNRVVPSTLARIRRLAATPRRLAVGEPRDLEQIADVLADARDRGMIAPTSSRCCKACSRSRTPRSATSWCRAGTWSSCAQRPRPTKLLQVIIESNHSRFPVIGDDRDEVVGIVLAKDLLKHFAEGGEENFDIRECLRPAVFIPESKRLNTLLTEFRESHNHMAIVVDEYGGVSGLLTIEDVLEQIVGDIDDEYDVDESEGIRKDGERTYAVPALTRIEDFNARSARASATTTTTRSAASCCTNSAACRVAARRSRSAASNSR